MKKILHIKIEIVSDIALEFSDNGGDNKLREFDFDLPENIKASRGDKVLLPPVYVNTALRALVWRTLPGDVQETLTALLYSPLIVEDVTHDIRLSAERYSVSLTL